MLLSGRGLIIPEESPSSESIESYYTEIFDEGSTDDNETIEDPTESATTYCRGGRSG